MKIHTRLRHKMLIELQRPSGPRAPSMRDEFIAQIERVLVMQRAKLAPGTYMVTVALLAAEEE